MRILLTLAIVCMPWPAIAGSLKDIVLEKSRSVVYLEVRNADGGVLNRGSGFIVSHDGYVVTVAHLRVNPNQRLWAVIGERFGTAFPLEHREIDEGNDVALWQFPQSPLCRPALTLARKRPELLDLVVSLGFPGSSGLTPNVLTINNLQTSRGNLGLDGFLEPGNSGGPVVNQRGQVIGIVQAGGLPGTENNEVVPIAAAIALLQKRNVGIGLDGPLPYPENCYPLCRHPQHGIESWEFTTEWSRDSGWMGGGHNPTAECSKIAAAVAAEVGADDVAVTSTDETHKKDVFGRVEYKYFCRGIARRGPVYVERRSPACGIWN